MYLTFHQLCERPQLSDKTVTKLIVANQLPPPLRVGKSRRWDSGEVDAFIKEHQQEAAIVSSNGC
jgi:predicted DNA-binding transcriptional regulator AlpA